MSKIDYGLLDALNAVVQNGSFEAASKSMNLTQSAISQRVKQLEERIGGIVVIRGRPCVPTELGLELCRHVEQVGLLEHQLNRRLDEQTTQFGSRPATLRIAVNTDSLSTWFPSVIRRVSRELLVHLDITADDQDLTANVLSKGEALAAVTSGEFPIQGFRRVLLGAMEYTAVATPEFIETHFPQGCSPANFASAPCLSFDKVDTLPQKWLLSTFEENIDVEGHRIPSFSGYLKSCKSGLGWGMMPVSTISQDLAKGTLVELEKNTTISVPLYWQASTKSSDILSKLATIVVAEAKRHLSQNAK